MSASQTTQYTPEKDIPGIVASARKAFDSGVTKSIAWRKDQLRGIIKMLNEQKPVFTDALVKDLRQSAFAAELAEFDGVMKDAQSALAQLDEWLQPEQKTVPLFLQPAKAYVVREPLGVVLIIAPWNYPFRLMMLPLIGALAAGNCAILKPSEVTGYTCAALVKILPQYVDPNCVKFVLGAAAETQALLKERFDHIFYTGNGKVGRIVARAAAEHLTPTTLELGGKCPAIIDRSCDQNVAARRIISGKFINMGQTCIAPDYLLIDKQIEASFTKKLQECLVTFYGADQKAQATTGDLSRIVSEHHTKRLSQALEETLKDGQAQLIAGGQVDIENKYIQPTLIKSPSLNSPLMKEEIFGPILPIVVVNDSEEAVKFVRDQREKPLEIYIFASDRKVVDKVLRETSSGGVAINDCVLQGACLDLPFGGVGESGMGSYHGRATFETFSHHKSVLDKGTTPDPMLRYPPYNDTKITWISRLNNLSLPRMPSAGSVAAFAVGLGYLGLRSRL